MSDMGWSLRSLASLTLSNLFWHLSRVPWNPRQGYIWHVQTHIITGCQGIMAGRLSCSSITSPRLVYVHRRWVLIYELIYTPRGKMDPYGSNFVNLPPSPPPAICQQVRPGLLLFQGYMQTPRTHSYTPHIDPNTWHPAPPHHPLHPLHVCNSN